jgi:hypothetical protein
MTSFQAAKTKQWQGEIFYIETFIERSRNGVSTPLNDHNAHRKSKLICYLLMLQKENEK